MGQWYEIAFTTPTNFTDSFGNVSYNVKFVDELDAVLMAVNPQKTKLEPGMKLFGHIENVPTKKDPSKTYRKFVREQPDEPGETTNTERKSFASKESDKSDGMRQGMCINNAASYVNACTRLASAQAMSKEQWANTVHEYAEELYSLGDLNPHVTDSTQQAQTDGKDVVYEPTEDEMNGALDLGEIDKIFPGAQNASPGTN